MNSVVSATTRPPSELPRADFAFVINFERGKGSASRIFSATTEFIKACEELDAELVKTIDSSIETVLVLEDIEAGSIKTYLRTLLQSTDDEALKSLDWKPQVGKYLVKAKYIVLKWVDDPNSEHSVADVQEQIKREAKETNVRRLPGYKSPSGDLLVNAARNFQKVKDSLQEGDSASFISGDDGESWDFNITIPIAIDKIEEMVVAHTMRGQSEMILHVKKPDYLGKSKWQLRHGQRTLDAKIEDKDWLSRFQSREVRVLPGDALRCIVIIENQYGHDNELLHEKHTISKVLDVLENADGQYDVSSTDEDEEEDS